MVQEIERACAALCCAMLVGACGGGGDADGKADASAGKDAGGHARAGGGARDASAGDAAGAPCDLTGTWIAQHVTRNSALGAEQVATNWNYHAIEQDGDRFTITRSYDCGYVVRGTTDVSLPDATLDAMARSSTNAVGTQGTFKPSGDGKTCQLAFDRIYVIRGANKEKFLDAVWQVGDAPKELDEFDMPQNADEGMEDWDEDGHEGLTQLTGFGDRYTAQIDWHAFHGKVPGHAAQFGGEGVISVDYDAHEVVSAETPALLQTSSVPMSPGYGFLARADDELGAAEEGEDAALQTCKQVQALAIERFGDPPAP